MTLGEKIKKARQLRNWTQAQLATISGLPLARIQQYETNFRHPKQPQLEAIAKALGVSIEYFNEFSLETCHSIMFALFELEDTFNLKIEKLNGKCVLSFDDKQLSHYLSMWEKEKEKSRLSQETLNSYNEWKITFPQKIIEETTKMIDNARNDNTN